MANEKRLISYDALITHLDSCIEQGKGLFKSVCVAIKCFVEQMPTVDAVEVVQGGDWIRVSECLPALHGETCEDFDGSLISYEISEWLLGVDKAGEVNVVIYESGPLGRGWMDRDYRTLNITHWMPLPEPPKEVGHG